MAKNPFAGNKAPPFGKSASAKVVPDKGSKGGKPVPAGPPVKKGKTPFPFGNSKRK